MKLSKEQMILKIHTLVGRVKFKAYFTCGKISIAEPHRNEFLFERDRNGYIAQVFIENKPENSLRGFSCKRLYAIDHLGEPYKMIIIDKRTNLEKFYWFRDDDSKNV